MTTAKKPRNRKKKLAEEKDPTAFMFKKVGISDPWDIPDHDRAELRGMLEELTPWQDACHAIGLNPRSFARWMREAEDDEIKPAAEEEFRLEMHRARARGIARASRQVARVGVDALVQIDGEMEVDPKLAKTQMDASWRLLMVYRGNDYGHERTFGLAGVNAPASAMIGHGVGPKGLPAPGRNLTIDLTPDMIEATLSTLDANGVKVPEKARESFVRESRK